MHPRASLHVINADFDGAYFADKRRNNLNKRSSIVLDPELG